MTVTMNGDEESLPDLSSMKVAASEVSQYTRVKNRRKHYLDTHPEYFGSQLELADPLLYDRLIRRFQTSAEREAEGRRKGYSGILEADLMRGEAKMEALKHPDSSNLFAYKRGMNGEILAEEKDEVRTNKEDGMERWKYIMGQRFLTGGDQDFDYTTVDENDSFDDKTTEEQDAEDVYFDGQTPEFSGRTTTELHGETGVQDF